MAYLNTKQTGLCEKAARLALCFHVVYSQRTGRFVGYDEGCRKAQAALDEWMAKESRKDRMAVRVY